MKILIFGSIFDKIHSKTRKLKTIYNSIRDRRSGKTFQGEEFCFGNVNEWKRSHYIILSEIIKDELSEAEELKGGKKFEIGNTISHVTLQRFLKMIIRIKPIVTSDFLKHLIKSASS